MCTLFNKKINIKNYDCSLNNINYNKINPMINLYIQSSSFCNGKCDFCNCEPENNNFDFIKLKIILQELNSKIILGKVSITGGESLLNIERTLNIINIIKIFNNYIVLNTNGYNLDSLKQVYDYVDEINLSKHHYNNDKNNEIMKLKTPPLEQFHKNNLLDKVKINCVFQKGYIDSYEELNKFLNYVGNLNIKELRSISLLPLTEKSKEKYIDLSDIMKQCEHFLNSGYLYDKHFCKCFEYIYVSTSGNIVKNTMRQTYSIEESQSCVRSLVFDGNYLYDGFKKNNIIF